MNKKTIPKQRHLLKPITTVVIIFVLAGIALGLFYLLQNRFPAPKEPIAKKYEWQYKGKSYSLTETLYGSTDKYYEKKLKGIFSNFEEISLSRYLSTPTEDKTIDKVAQKIAEIAKENGMSLDQVVDLAIGFVQYLPYDEARAKTDLTHPRYPFETLYEGTGICSDKTLLTVAVLKKLGYGTAIFMYESDQHMAAAVQCSREYSNYNSGYCIAETTAIGHKVGIIPELSRDNLQAVARSEAQTFDANSFYESQNKILSLPEIFSKTEGKVYQGVIQTILNEREIEDLAAYFERQKPVIEQKEKNLDDFRSQLDIYRASNDYRAYNNLVPEYNNLISEIRDLIDSYNNKVARYNILIKE